LRGGETGCFQWTGPIPRAWELVCERFLITVGGGERVAEHGKKKGPGTKGGSTIDRRSCSPLGTPEKATMSKGVGGGKKKGGGRIGNCITAYFLTPYLRGRLGNGPGREGAQKGKL